VTYEIAQEQEASSVQDLLNRLEKILEKNYGSMETDCCSHLWDWGTTFEDWKTKVWDNGLYDNLLKNFAFTPAQLEVQLRSCAESHESLYSAMQSEYQAGGPLAVSYLRIISYKVPDTDKRIIGLTAKRAHFRRGFIGSLIRLWTIPAQEIMNTLKQSESLACCSSTQCLHPPHC
jgi:hypothetical protein